MKVEFEKSFLKDIQKLNDKNTAIKLKAKLLEFEEQADLATMQNIKKLKGHKSYYRLKIGDYRLGFSYEEGKLNIIRFLHRKDIYKLFP
ncbi:MAG: type II toxin-antitoxin system RelE/ParE family toxin [Sulfurimonas sp.]|jgi:mRNA interferase RelE/StbE